MKHVASGSCRGRHTMRAMREPQLNLSPSPGDEVKTTTCVCAHAHRAAQRAGRCA
jgi:hypothetical protein